MIDKIENYIKSKFSFLDEENQNKLINQAVVSLKQEFLILQELLQNKEKESILKTIHKIKGILLNVGLKDIAKELNDDVLKNFSIEEIEEKITPIIKNFSSLL